MIFVRKDILVKFLSTEDTEPIAVFFFEPNFHKKKWLFATYIDLRSQIKDSTYFKDPENPSCIDLILTSNPCSFQTSCVIETGPSDLHKMTVIFMKNTFQKLKPKIMLYRDYIKLSNYYFRKKLLIDLLMENSANSNALEIFLQLCISTNGQFANKERKSTRGNNKHFSNKSLACGHKQRKRYRNR